MGSEALNGPLQVKVPAVLCDVNFSCFCVSGQSFDSRGDLRGPPPFGSV